MILNVFYTNMQIDPLGVNGKAARAALLLTKCVSSICIFKNTFVGRGFSYVLRNILLLGFCCKLAAALPLSLP